MYDNQRIKLPRRREKEPEHSVFDPDKFWGQVLSGPATTTAEQDSFNVPVEGASCHLLPATQRPHGTA
jgi:hypothetical protein